jgi:hypothetical protein
MLYSVPLSTWRMALRNQASASAWDIWHMSWVNLGNLVNVMCTTCLLTNNIQLDSLFRIDIVAQQQI